MHRVGGIAGFAQCLHQTLRAVFGSGKDDGRILAVFREFLNQKIGLGSPCHEMHLLGDFVSHLAGAGDRHALRVFQIGCSQFVHMFRHGGREQHGLALCGQQRRNLAQRMDEPKIQHLIGLIQDQKLSL